MQCLDDMCMQEATQGLETWRRWIETTFQFRVALPPFSTVRSHVVDRVSTWSWFENVFGLGHSPVDDFEIGSGSCCSSETWFSCTVGLSRRRSNPSLRTGVHVTLNSHEMCLVPGYHVVWANRESPMILNVPCPMWTNDIPLSCECYCCDFILKGKQVYNMK